jgi:hypothetical protein
MKIESFIKLLQGEQISRKAVSYIKEGKTFIEPDQPSIADLNKYIFLCGDCWRFALIIKAVYPEAKAHMCWNIKGDYGHIVIELNEKFYDITGRLRRRDWHIDKADVSTDRLRRWIPISFDDVKNHINSGRSTHELFQQSR